MNPNPYQSPEPENADSTSDSPERQSALRRVRVTLLIFLVPAAYNFLCFNFPSVFSESGGSVHPLYQLINGALFVGIALTVWGRGLALLEFVAKLIHRYVARRASYRQWCSALYETLGRAPAIALCGAVLWAIWVAAFYQLQVDFYALSIPVGIVAHLLAAALYLPLGWRWYQLEREAENKA